MNFGIYTIFSLKSAFPKDFDLIKENDKYLLLGSKRMHIQCFWFKWVYGQLLASVMNYSKKKNVFLGRVFLNSEYF